MEFIRSSVVVSKTLTCLRMTEIVYFVTPQDDKRFVDRVYGNGESESIYRRNAVYVTRDKGPRLYHMTLTCNRACELDVCGSIFKAHFVPFISLQPSKMPVSPPRPCCTNIHDLDFPSKSALPRSFDRQI